MDHIFQSDGKQTHVMLSNCRKFRLAQLVNVFKFLLKSTLKFKNAEIRITLYYNQNCETNNSYWILNQLPDRVSLFVPDIDRLFHERAYQKDDYFDK